MNLPVGLMRRLPLIRLPLSLLPLLFLLPAGVGTAQPATEAAGIAPFTVRPELFDPALPDTLGLQHAEGTSQITVFRATDGGNKYNHAAVLMPFKGRLYIQWQSSALDEDAPDTALLYSVSNDAGRHWSAPAVLAPARDKVRDKAIVTSGGWWTRGDTLVAYINVWPDALSPKGGHVEFIASHDGRTWSTPRPVTDAQGRPLQGVIEQDLRALPGGRLLTAVHLQPGLIAKPMWTDDPLGISGWTIGALDNLPHAPDMSRELEPSWFLKRDGAVVMTFRDQGNSFHVLAAQSLDRGEHWSQATVTGLPDSRAKQSAGNLPDGSAFIVNNPSGNKARIPLVITLSRDGEQFDRALLLRDGDAELPAQRYPGRYKRAGFSYPKSIVWNGALYVSYAINKEDIAVTRVPVSALMPRPEVLAARP